MWEKISLAMWGSVCSFTVIYESSLQGHCDLCWTCVHLCICLHLSVCVCL